MSDSVSQSRQRVAYILRYQKELMSVAELNISHLHIIVRRVKIVFNDAIANFAMITECEHAGNTFPEC